MLFSKYHCIKKYHPASSALSKISFSALSGPETGFQACIFSYKKDHLVLYFIKIHAGTIQVLTKACTKGWTIYKKYSIGHRKTVNFARTR